MIKIGIDLATRITGISILNSDNKILSTALWQNLWNDNKYRMIMDLNLQCFKLVEEVKRLQQDNESVLLVVEVGDFGNSKMTNRFTSIASIITTYIANKFRDNIDIKWINSNEWRRHIGIACTNDREKCKQLARDYCYSKLGYNKAYNVQDDITDSICIASVGEMVIDTDIRHIDIAKEKSRIARHKRYIASKKNSK